MLTGVGFMVAIHFMGDNVSGGGARTIHLGNRKIKKKIIEG